MPEKHTIHLGPFDEIEIHADPPEMIVHKSDDYRAYRHITNGRRRPSPPQEPPPTDPPDPDPGPGTIIFEEGFEGPIEEAVTMEKGFFTRGNSTTHKPPGGDAIPVPPEMGDYSLRCKQLTGDTGDGKFPPSESDAAMLFVDIPAAGSYAAQVWRVAHDTGKSAVRVRDAAGRELGAIHGTAKLSPYEWIMEEIPFSVAAAERISVLFEYTAPVEITRQSGIKCALLRVIRLS